VVLAFLGIGFTFFANSLAGMGGLFGDPVPLGPINLVFIFPQGQKKQYACVKSEKN
jgi:hypothetical protein